jgi:hypothetical protein
MQNSGSFPLHLFLAVFFAPFRDFFAVFRVLFLAPFLAPFFGTFAPFFLASDKPIAIACFRLVTFLPLPLFNWPRFFLCMARFTFLPAPFEYFAIRFVFPETHKKSCRRAAVLFLFFQVIENCQDIHDV